MSFRQFYARAAACTEQVIRLQGCGVVNMTNIEVNNGTREEILIETGRCGRRSSSSSARGTGAGSWRRTCPPSTPPTEPCCDIASGIACQHRRRGDHGTDDRREGAPARGQPPAARPGEARPEPARARRARGGAARIEAYRQQPTLPTLCRILAAADLELRIGLEDNDDHDDVLDERWARMSDEERRAADEAHRAFISALQAGLRT